MHAVCLPRCLRGVTLAGLAALMGTGLAHGTDAPPEPVTCQTIQAVHDGDTLTCTPQGSAPFVVRVAGVDAPERGQAYWQASREALKHLAQPGTRAACYKTDRYARQVCRLSSPNGEDLSLALVHQGLAWHTQSYQDEQTPQERALYAAAQEQARQARRGLWRQAQPQAPWDCRRLRRQHQSCR